MKSKIKHSIRFAFAVIIVVFFVVGVPIIINECYKSNSGYFTLWGAADVLSYYGTILGAAVTVAALIVTIIFTRKQIQRESYLREENEKWLKIEAVFSAALNDINPIRPLMGTMDTGFAAPADAINILQKYQMACRTATDQLNAHLNTTDYPKVKELINAIAAASDHFFQISQEQVTVYSKLRDFMHRDTAKKTIDIELQNPASFPTETITFCQELIHDTNGLQFEDIRKSIGQLNEKMVSAYETTYKSLLQRKGLTFEIINTEIQKQADRILRLWAEH